MPRYELVLDAVRDDPVFLCNGRSVNGRGSYGASRPLVAAVLVESTPPDEKGWYAIRVSYTKRAAVDFCNRMLRRGRYAIVVPMVPDVTSYPPRSREL
jgi:hypothetical protein